MTPVVTIFLLNLLTSIDNAIVTAGIVKKTQHSLVLVGLASAVILTVCRTALIMGVLSVAWIPGFRIGVGIVVLWVAIGLSQVSAGSTRRQSVPFSRLLVMVVGTDLALSIDNILSLSVVTQNVWVVGFGVLTSLIPLMLLLPMIVRVMKQVVWIQVLAAGFVAELGVDVITDDKFLINRVPSGWREAAIRTCSAGIVIGWGFWQLHRSKRRWR